MSCLHSRHFVPSLAALVALASLFLSACDHAKDLVEQGKKQAADIQKSLETKTEEAKSNPSGAASTPENSGAATTPASTPPAATVTPSPTPAADPVLLIEAFLKENPKKKTNATLQALGALPEEFRARITECNLDESLVDDIGLAEVAKFPNLVKISLVACTQISDNGLAAIKELKLLEVVVLERCRITDAGMVHLRNLSNLKVLNLNKTAITDAGFLKLAPTSLSHLEELYLTSVKVDGSCFRRVPPGASLRVLVANDTWLGLNIDIVKAHRNLEELNLHNAQVSDNTVAALKGHAKLRILHLGGNGLSNKGVQQLTGLAGLEDLTLRSSLGISDACLSTFKSCTKLTHFGDAETNITPAGRAYIKKFAPKCTFDSP